MKSMMSRTTLREIKLSFGRYFAILAIVALGVGFFSGLKVTRDVMVASADTYLKEGQMYDFRLLSTLGFEQEDVTAFAAREDVRAAEGAVSADIIYLDAGDNEGVVKAHSLTQEINKVVLVAGRMPEQADECVVDGNLYGESDIGSRIRFSENNAQDDLDNFAYQEYTITGIVKSPLYVQFERGTTSLGNGQIKGFIYLLPEGFDMEAYTEIYVKFNQDEQIYSDKYNDDIDAKEEIWKEYCRLQGERRFRSIVDEAEKELADARKELEEKRIEAEEELEDARKELEDAREKLAEGERELAQGEQEVADGKKELTRGRQELEDGKKEIEENRQKLEEGRQTLSENEALLAEKKQEYEAGKASYESGKRELDSQKARLEEAGKQIAEAEAQFAAAQQQLAAAEARLIELQSQIEAMAAAGTPEELLAPYRQQLQAGEAELQAGRAALAAQMEAAGLEAKKAELQAGWDQIAEAEGQLAGAWAQLSQGAGQIAEAEAQLAQAKTEIQDGERQLAEGEQELAKAEGELQEAQRKLRDAEKELEEGRRELEEGRTELEEGQAEYDEAYEEFVNEIADAEKEIAEAQEEIDDLETPDTYVLGRDTNIGYVCFESDSSIVDGIANVFPVFFFLVAALVCMTTMNRMVEEQRTQIGVLKALGYGEAAIMGKFLFYSGSAALTGCLGGYFLGIHVFPYVIWYTYGIMYRFGEIVYVFDWPMLIISLVGALACSMGTTWVSCRHELKENAAGLMRPRAPKAGKRVFLERVPFIWKRLKFLQKVSVRNIVRYKKRFFMMVIGISGCTALLVTGFGVRDSVTDIADRQFGEIQIYDIGVTLKEKTGISIDGVDSAVLTEELTSLVEKLGGSCTFAYEGTMDLAIGGGIKSVNLVVAQRPEEIGDYFDIHTDSGQPLAYPERGEAVISRKLAESYHLGPGDMITLQDENQKTIQAVVSGVCENYIYNYVYLRADTLEEIMDVVDFRNAYIKLPAETDMHEAGAAFMGLEDVTAVSVIADMQVRFSSMMGSMNYIVLVIIGCAACLAFIVLYNLNNINITERIREIATIKVLGFYKRETAVYVFRENLVLTAIGCGAGLVLGKLLHMYVMHEVDIDMIAFDVKITVTGYLLSILLTFLFNWVVNRMMSGKLDRINMAESLKSVD